MRRPDDASRLGIAGRWCASICLVAVGYAGLVTAALHFLPSPEVSAAEPAAAVMIELAPLPVSASDTPDVAPDTPMVEAQPEPEPEPPIAEPILDPLPEIAELPPDLLPQVEDFDLPEVPPVPDAAALLTPPPPPPPEPVEKVEPKPKPKPVVKPKPKPKPVERRKPVNRDKPPAPRTAAAPSSDAPRAQTTAAPVAGASRVSSSARASWIGSVMAHLNRHKRGVDSRGTARVAFTFDASGRVGSARVVVSSGNASLDAEAVALIRRASPIPAPPPGMPSGAILPIRFN